MNKLFIIAMLSTAGIASVGDEKPIDPYKAAGDALIAASLQEDRGLFQCLKEHEGCRERKEVCDEHLLNCQSETANTFRLRSKDIARNLQVNLRLQADAAARTAK